MITKFNWSNDNEGTCANVPRPESSLHRGEAGMKTVSRRNALFGLGASGIAVTAGIPICRTGIAGGVKEVHELKPGEFTWHPERSPNGPVAVVVSIPDQLVHVYRNAVRIAVSTCSTGKKGHGTPTGVFTILEKDKHHRSSTYNNAPMPNMNRLTWRGIALHAGNLPGYPASHGCIRLPLKFSELLFGLTHVGTPVIIAGSHNEPTEVVHPGLVLGDYASHEFDTVKTSLKTKQSPWAATVTDFSAPASIVISAADRTGTLLINGKVVGRRPVEISDPAVPLGSHVFMLSEAHVARQGLSWHAVGHHEDIGVVPGLPEESVLTRISTTAATRQVVSKYLHPGMTLVTTDMPSHPDSRTARDFVVMSQAVS